MISFCSDIMLANTIAAQRNTIIIIAKFCDFLKMILKIEVDKSTLDVVTIYVDFLFFKELEYDFFLILIKKRISYDMEKIIPNIMIPKITGESGKSLASTCALTTEISNTHSITNFKNLDLKSLSKKLKSDSTKYDIITTIPKAISPINKINDEKNTTQKTCNMSNLFFSFSDNLGHA